MMYWKCAFLFLSSLQLHLVSMEAMTYITLFYCHKYSGQTYFQTHVSGHQMQKRHFPILKASSCFLEDSQSSCKLNCPFFIIGLCTILEFFRLFFCIYTVERKFFSIWTYHHIGMVTFDANMVPVPLHLLVSLNNFKE